MTNELSAYEAALRRLPPSYSLVLRLRDAGVAPEVMCEYVDVEAPDLAGVLRIAEEKLAQARQRTIADRLQQKRTSTSEEPR